MITDYQRPPVRIALMGLGRSMFAEHYPIFKAHPALFDVVCACDLSKERRDMVAKDYPNCKMFRQFGDMLDERDIDLVDIATPSIDHVGHAIQSLKKGFWTLIESPLALTIDDAQLILGQARKSKNRLIVFQRDMFAPDYLLAQQMIADPRLGALYQIRVRKEDYVRRDDWQCIKRLGGGAAYYAMTDLIIQTLRLLPTPPVQMWSELKRLASLGDAEDYAHLILKARDLVSADVEFSGGCLEPLRGPSFEIRGDMGVFRAWPGQTEGELICIDPKFKFPRRRSSVRTPPIVDLHENVPLLQTKIALPKGTQHGPAAFWKHVYDSVRIAAPFPVSLENSIEAVRFAQLMKKTSPFGK